MGRASGELSSAHCLWLWCWVILYSHDCYFPCFLLCIKIQGKTPSCQGHTEAWPGTSDRCCLEGVVCHLAWYNLLFCCTNFWLFNVAKPVTTGITKPLCIWWLVGIKIYILTREYWEKLHFWQYLFLGSKKSDVQLNRCQFLLSI